jgi:hypothetical protein
MAKQPRIKVLFIAAVNEDAKKPFMPCFVSLMVSVNKKEYNDGDQFTIAEALLKEKGYGEPYVLYTEEECPKWLLAAFKRGRIEGCAVAEYRNAVVEREKVFARGGKE